MTSLKAFFLESLFGAITSGLTSNYITPFALKIGAQSFHIGILNSSSNFLSSIVQLISPEVTEVIKNRVKFIASSAVSMGICFILVSITPFIFKKNSLIMFILFISLITAICGIATPPWASLLSETVEKTKYGEYFAWRKKILGLVGLVSTFFGGFLLFVFDKQLNVPNKVIGFSILFFLAGICRFFSAYYQLQLKETLGDGLPTQKFNYFEFIRRFKESNFVKFMFFVVAINFGLFICKPFFSVYLLRDIGVEYSTFAIITTLGSIAGLFGLPIWGKLADKFGNVRVIKISAFFVPIIPVLWIVSKNIYYLMTVNAFTEYILAGFGLCFSNFIFDATSKIVRTRCIAYFNFTNEIFVSGACLLGGWLSGILPPLFTNSKLLTLFFISGLFCSFAVFLLRNSFTEVRKTEQIKDIEILGIITGVSSVLNLCNNAFIKQKKSDTS